VIIFISMRLQLNLEAPHVWQFAVNVDMARLMRPEGELLQPRGGDPKYPEVGVVLPTKKLEARSF
jgi:hypothetical protein